MGAQKTNPRPPQLNSRILIAVKPGWFKPQSAGCGVVSTCRGSRSRMGFQVDSVVAPAHAGFVSLMGL